MMEVKHIHDKKPEEVWIEKNKAGLYLIRYGCQVVNRTMNVVEARRMAKEYKRALGGYFLNSQPRIVSLHS